MNAQCIMVCSGKGGTGKSTVSVLLGACRARLGRKTLLVELDAGLRSEDKVSARGTPYSVLLFTPEAQRMVVEHFIKAEASPAGEAVTEGD